MNNHVSVNTMDMGGPTTTSIHGGLDVRFVPRTVTRFKSGGDRGKINQTRSCGARVEIITQEPRDDWDSGLTELQQREVDELVRLLAVEATRRLAEKVAELTGGPVCIDCDHDED